MFASSTVLEHLVRGAIGIAALVVAVVAMRAHPVLTMLALPVAVVALRGCPMCWTMGLVQTVVGRLRGRAAAAACIDGRCARRASADLGRP